MSKIFDRIETIPVDQIVSEAADSLQRSGGSQNDPVVERLDKLIVLLGRLAFQPHDIQQLPKVYSIDLSKTVKDAPLGMSKAANSITFLKPDADFTVKFGVLINGSESIMTEYKKIPLGRDTVINGIPVQDVYYTTAGAAGANPVEVFTAWI